MVTLVTSYCQPGPLVVRRGEVRVYHVVGHLVAANSRNNLGLIHLIHLQDNTGAKTGQR